MATGHAWAGFWSLWAFLLTVKLWLASRLPLFGDEAFYWLESRHLAAAYDDVPALTPWLIALGTAAFGDSWLAVRLPFLAIGAFTAGWLAHCVARVSGRAAGGWAGILALLLPLFAINGLLALPDVPLTLAVLCCAEAMRRLNISAGAVGGGLLAVGLALGWLSHYRFLVPFAAGGLWLVLDPCGRALLRQPAVWGWGVLGSAVGLTPLLWHQIGRDGAGFAFQFADRHPWQFQLEGVADPLLQVLAATPGLAVVLLIALAVAWRRRSEPAIAPLVWTAGAMLVVYMGLAPFVDTDRSRVHWPLPGWLLLAMLAGPIVVGWSKAGRRWVLAAVALAGVMVTAAFGYLALAAVAPQHLATTRLYPENFVGWPEISQRVAAELADMPDDTVLAADTFMLAAQLSFALQGRDVYALDHPANAKHGRQGELSRWRLDQTALQAVSAQRPLLLVMEEGASRLRQRPDWFRGVCAQFPAAKLHFELMLHHDSKRFIGYLHEPTEAAGCTPPALAYLHAPEFGERVIGELHVNGWALRDAIGIKRMWLRIDDGAPIPLDYGLPAPGVSTLFPASDDPSHPNVGFEMRLRLPQPAGRYWVRIEAEAADGRRSIVAAVPIDWVPSDGQAAGG